MPCPVLLPLALMVLQPLPSCPPAPPHYPSCHCHCRCAAGSYSAAESDSMLELENPTHDGMRLAEYAGPAQGQLWEGVSEEDVCPDN